MRQERTVQASLFDLFAGHRQLSYEELAFHLEDSASLKI
jgi:hypothetical protein